MLGIFLAHPTEACAGGFQGMAPKNPPHSLAVACPRPNLNEHPGTRAISHSIPRRTPPVNTDGVRWFAESSAHLRFTWHRSVDFVHHCDIAAMPEKSSRTNAREPRKSRKSLPRSGLSP